MLDRAVVVFHFSIFMPIIICQSMGGTSMIPEPVGYSFQSVAT